MKQSIDRAAQAALTGAHSALTTALRLIIIARYESTISGGAAKEVFDLENEVRDVKAKLGCFLTEETKGD